MKSGGLSFYRGVSPTEGLYRGVGGMPPHTSDGFYRGMQPNIPTHEGWHRAPTSQDPHFPYFM